MQKAGTTMEEQQHFDGDLMKILFDLEQDEDGYPPVTVESVWAKKTADNLYEVDNIPFYVRGVGYRDVVDAEKFEGALHFRNLVRASGHSTVRVVLFDSGERDDLLKRLEGFGCSWEGGIRTQSHCSGYSPTSDLRLVLQFLRDGRDRDRWDHEEACLAQ